MLTQLLALLDEGHAFSLGELAQRLEVGEDLVKAQMEYLERLGMLRRINLGGGCKGCPGHCGGGCSRCETMPPGLAMWERVS